MDWFDTLTVDCDPPLIYYGRMHKDRIISGKTYRLIVEPYGVNAPTGESVSVYIIDGSPNGHRVYKRDKLLSETEEDLEAAGWREAESHARSSAS
jgi:hypothetical protein